MFKAMLCPFLACRYNRFLRRSTARRWCFVIRLPLCQWGVSSSRCSVAQRVDAYHILRNKSNINEKARSDSRKHCALASKA